MMTHPGSKRVFIAVSRLRGRQLKELAQFDGWLRDGFAAYIESLCDWT